ncbi:winged helix-turn-helix domain-containing protein [Kitasatospora sp. RB6PN24]|uniref:winged helix-turn-helix domain-containing protein n=1 Tax=Kitasatospora humi TaxID=2893891 RepID=UPI001E4B4862|nr:winged helix-turn-helix domain-containing protein [Kitasatospora humi]MCC9309703.1 winged helix-turn-helix domain-containing protein [Kitasatospora humi]
MPSSTATLTPPATPQLRALRAVTNQPTATPRRQSSAAELPPPAPELIGALPVGATVVATVPQSALPPGLLAQYGAQADQPGGVRPLVGYLVLVPAESAPGAVSAPAAVPAPGAVSAPVPAAVSAMAPVAAVPAPRPAVPSARGISVDPDRRTAYVDGQSLELTYLEFELLAHLTRHPHRVHTRDHLVTAVWGYGHVGDGRTVDVHVARLRRKLGAAYRGSIVTVRRVGYKYAPNVRS